VALGAITTGLITSVDNVFQAGGADFSILNKETDAMTDTGTANLDEEWINRIQNISGVKAAKGFYLIDVPIDNGVFSTSLIGIDLKNNGLSTLGAKLKDGRMIQNDSKEVLAGKVFLEQFNKSIGDKINIKGQPFTIVGSYEIGDPNQDSGLMGSINNTQKLDNAPGKLSVLLVHVESGVDVKSVTKEINSSYGKNITTVTSIEELETMADSLAMVNGASWAISILAIVVGGIGIINTMVMSVYERTKEIGVLKSVGWKDRRILAMILGESIVLTTVAGIIGSIIGVAVCEILVAAGVLSISLIPVYTINPFLQAFGVAIIVGLIGGFYPAYRASKLPPTEALKYEV
jgi:putative ABC transport system permease protein